MITDRILKLNHYNKTVVFVSLINLVLTFVALLKDISSAYYLGTSIEADALYLAFFIPDTIGNNLFSSSIGVACVPVFSILLVTKNHDILYKVIRKIFAEILITSTIVFFILFLFKEKILFLLNVHTSNILFEITLRLLTIILPIMIFFPLVGFCTSILYATNHFKSAAIIPIFFNIIFLIGMFFTILFKIPINIGVNYISYCILLGVFGMLLFAITAVFTAKNKTFNCKRIFKKSCSDSKDEVRYIKEILFVLLPYIGIMIFTFSIQFIERYFAAPLGEGSIAGLNYVYRLVQFPIWVFVAATGNVLLPKLSQLKGLELKGEFNEHVEKSLNITFLITIPLAIIIFILREQILWVLLKRGAFNFESLELTSNLLKGYSFAIVGLGLLAMLLKYFVALGKLKLPLLMYLFYALLNVFLDSLLVKKYGLIGIGIGASVATIINSFAMLALLKKYLNINYKKIIFNLNRILISNLPVVILMVFLRELWYHFNIYINNLLILLYVLISGICFCLVYYMSIRFLKIENII